MDFTHRPKKTRPGDDERDRRRLTPEALISDPQWQSWFRGLGRPSDAECVDLIETVYALGDLQARARAMRLDFLVYLLGMARQETLEQLRVREPGD